MRRVFQKLWVFDNSLAKRVAFGIPFLCVLPTLGFLAYSIIPSHQPFLTNDSASYMYFDASRPAGYPIFLLITKSIFRTYHAVRFLQIGIFCLSIGLLAYGLMIATGSLILGIAIEIAVLGNPGPIQLANQIMSDSLSASLIAGSVGVTLIYIRRRNVASLMALTFLVAGALSVRPINIALIPPAVLAILAFGHGMPVTRWFQLAVLVIGIMIGLGVTPVTDLIVRRARTASYFS